MLSQCSQSDWINLCLVSSHFRHLAAEHIYRSFNIVFPDEDDESFDSPCDGLAGGLDTFVTSDYNYAQHLREIMLDTLSVGAKAEMAYKSYLLGLSCGKFMNTLLYLTLRRAKSLDTFKWNIRVELSRPVYRALHNIKSLRRLHLRLPDGPSLYESPPTNWTAAEIPTSTPAVGMVAGQVTGPSMNNVGMASSVASLVPKPSLGGTLQKPVRGIEPKTLSGFKGLETLAILDIDNLDVIPEIRSCVHNSSSTLRKLKLSFSDELASQSRQTMEVDSEDSDQDDDFQVVAVPPTNYVNGNKTLAQQRRKEQETVLGQIFEFEPFPVKENNTVIEEPIRKDKMPDAKDAGQVFIDAVEKASRRMWANLEGYREIDVVSQQEVMDQIITAARYYVDSKTQAQENTSADTAGTDPAATSVGMPGSARQEGVEDQSGPSAGNEHTAKNVLFGSLAHAGEADTKPEDIDVDVPEEQLGLDEHDESSIEDQSDEPDDTIPSLQTHKVSPLLNASSVFQAVSQLDGKPNRLERHADEIIKEIQESGAALANNADRLENMLNDLVSVTRDKQTAKHEATSAKAKSGDIEREAKSTLDDQEELRRQVTDYARGTRGIALQSLSLHLIPTKASVLGRAVDLRTLTKITLLNVGPQSSIWALMIKENKLQPLPLQKIFTDNVCLYFLQLVSQLERVEELLMLERGHKYRPESLAQKTKVNIGQIRRAILKKHMHTLQILMIKNDSDTSWDIDDKTMQWICRRGKVLRELVVAAGISSMVSSS